MDHIILAINPGSTSTKIAVYKNEERLFMETIEHNQAEIASFKSLKDDFAMRRGLVIKILEDNNFDPRMLSAVVGRGGMLPPVKAGGYTVNEDMKKRIIKGPIQKHASNLGALLAEVIAKPVGVSAYIYDAVSSDEMREIAKVTGIPEIIRQPFCHVLNTKAMARKVAQKLGGSYEDLNFVVAHLGGGISISAHQCGRIVDAIEDDGGPFSPERSGSIPLQYIVDMCYSGDYSKNDMKKKLRGIGGLKAHLGTHDCREIEKMIAGGDQHARLIYEAQAYQIAKGIGELSPAIEGSIDGIIITGGVARSNMLTGMITKRVKFIAPVFIMPGENELESLAYGVLRILRGEEDVNNYVDNLSEEIDYFI